MPTDTIRLADADAGCEETTAVITIPKQVMTADLGDEIVLLMPGDGAYFALNSTAVQLWRELQYGPIGPRR